MLSRRIIACLDILDGQVVKGRKFQDLQLVGHPLELAKRYSDEGIDELVLLDISATLRDERSFFNVVESVAKCVAIPLTVGGGLRSENDILRMLRCGADKVSLNSILASDPDLIQRSVPWVGSQALVAALDAKRVATEDPLQPRWELKIKSGTVGLGRDALSFAREIVEKGAGELLVTSIDRDGTKSGYDLELLKALSDIVSVPIVASGGAGSKEHLREAFQQGAADAVLVASLFHFGDLKIRDLKDYLQRSGMEMRLD